MSSQFSLLVAFLSLISFVVILGFWMTYIRPALKPTTLVSAGIWFVLGLSAWILVTSAQLMGQFERFSIPVSFTSRGHYVSTILLLTPLVSVLGAKRPGIRFWNFFVVIPMLLMLNWPLIAEAFGTVPNRTLNLEPPALMGAFVVLMMVLGNYFGTLFTLPAVLYCLGIAFALTTTSESMPHLLESSLAVRGISGLLVTVSFVISARRMKAAAAQRAGFEGLWLDFRDWFGILWTRRVMDRLNQTAEQEGWVCRLTLEGLEWDADVAESARRETRLKMDHAFRWMFRRFVDEEWIDQRLEHSAKKLDS
ncbi:MAG: hypothetical protein HUJ26_01800 [Planctomycetaceae bacterium]|nr:hypothetical protein [Planctomycetaceae bacterium]